VLKEKGMTAYSDPSKIYTLEHPESWLPLTQEGSPHVSFASLTTGGYLKVEAYQIEQPAVAEMRPERILEALVACERRTWPDIGNPRIARGIRNGAGSAYVTYTRKEAPSSKDTTDFGHIRAWVFTRDQMQVRCLYRCRSHDAGTDDDELNAIINSLVIETSQPLSAEQFTSYYYNVLKRRRPQMTDVRPRDLTLKLADGQTVLLEHLFNHYRQEPGRIDELIDSHINLLDFCGDDVPDLSNFKSVKPLLFPKVFRATSSQVPSHRIPLWPGLVLGAVVQGSVFHYGVNADRLRSWGYSSLMELNDLLTDNLYAIPPVIPRGLKNDDGETLAISYVDHPFCASFVLYDDFYETTAQNLGASEFLVGLPDPSCVSCFRCDDPRFVVQHTALLRWDYHRSVERLTDVIYLVTGPETRDVKPYDVLHSCVKS
jgi:hypothetical protein